MYKEITKATIKKHNTAIQKSMLTKSEIGAICKLMNSMRYSSEERRKQIWDLYSRITETYKITEEQTQIGIEWLLKNLFTAKGKERETKLTQDFGSRDFDIVRNFAYFEFVGFQEHSNGYGSHWTPIYRTVAKNGEWFDYTAIHWGPCEIVGRGYYPTKLEKAM